MVRSGSPVLGPEEGFAKVPETGSFIRDRLALNERAADVEPFIEPSARERRLHWPGPG
jgi:hypothetical protein